MKQTYLAFDLGGTKTAVGLVDQAGSVLYSRTVATADIRSTGDVAGALIALGGEVHHMAGAPVLAGVGLSLPGPVDRGGPTMRCAPTIPELEGVPLRDVFADAFGVAVEGDNDANAGALAEALLGAGVGTGVVVYLTISTGIGGGVVIDRKIFRGASGTAAEFGHLPIMVEWGPACDCGGHGCLESLASGRAVSRRASAELGESLDAAELAARARGGDAVVIAVWRLVGRYIGFGLVSIVNAYDPGIIVFGGGVGIGAWDLLGPHAREVLNRRCMPRLRRPVRLAPAALGLDAPLIGAACLCFADPAQDAPEREIG